MLKTAITIALPLTLAAAAFASGTTLPLGLVLALNFALAAGAAYLICTAAWRTVLEGAFP